MSIKMVMKGRKDGGGPDRQESTAWPMITGKPKEGGLGFDYKWNMGWMDDFTRYMQCDPYFRKNNYGQLTFSMLYAYSEKFILVFSHDEVVHGKGSMMGKMPGETLEKKAENLRTAYGFMMGHPGKSFCLWARIMPRSTSGMKTRLWNGICSSIRSTSRCRIMCGP